MQFPTLVAAFVAALLPCVTMAAPTPADGDLNVFDKRCAAPKVTGKFKIGDQTFAAGQTYEHSHACAGQPDGVYTFTMVTSLSSLGLPGSIAGNTLFLVFDSKCEIKGIFSPGTDSCGTPWTINAGYLQKTLTISNVFMDVGDPFMQFTYGKIDHKTGQGECQCGSLPASGTTATESCACPFNVNGIPS